VLNVFALASEIPFV